MGGVGVDFQFSAERPHRRKWLASAKLAGNHSPFHRIDHLFVQ
jgi:hypothetical protein